MTFQYFFFDTYIGYFLQVIPIVIIVAAIYAVLRYRKLKRAGGEWTKSYEVCRLIFVCWLTGLVLLTVIPNNLLGGIWYWLFYHIKSGVEIRLFTFDYNFLPTFIGHFGMENLGNIIMFIPMGLLYPQLKKDVGWKGMLAAAFLFSLCIEFIQPIMGRAFDVNDLILNTLGGMLGFALSLAIKKLLSVLVPSRA